MIDIKLPSPTCLPVSAPPQRFGPNGYFRANSCAFRLSYGQAQARVRANNQTLAAWPQLSEGRRHARG